MGEQQGAGGVGVSIASDANRDQASWQAEGAGYVMHQGSIVDSADAILAHRQGFESYCHVPNSIPPVAVYEFDVSGGSTLTIDILGVSVTPSATTVQFGQSVHFSVASINFAGTGAITWSFDALDGQPQVSVTSCANLLVCDYVPPKTGRMEICMNDEQNYPICGLSSLINVIKCPTGDTILDNPIFRAALQQALKDSWADSVPSDRRHESAGWAYFDSTGLHVVRSENPANFNPCSVSSTYDQFKAVLLFHTHPFNPPEGFFGSADRLPSNCGFAAGSYYDVGTWGGPSAQDWRTSVDRQLPSYIIDKKRIYKTNPAVTDSTQWKASTKNYDWNTKKCRW
jgi:hypothetical protein